MVSGRVRISACILGQVKEKSTLKYKIPGHVMSICLAADKEHISVLD